MKLLLHNSDTPWYPYSVGNEVYFFMAYEIFLLSLFKKLVSYPEQSNHLEISCNTGIRFYQHIVSQVYIRRSFKRFMKTVWYLPHVSNSKSRLSSFLEEVADMMKQAVGA